jgi:transglutaminase-like putative cysteine protease
MTVRLAALAPVVLLLGATAPQVQQASFHVENAFTVKVPKGAARVRVWFAVPQEDAQSTIRNLSVVADGAVRYESDSWGNRVGYVEVDKPASEELVIREQFDLVRSEVHNEVKASDTRPLTDAERTALVRYLQPTTYVVVNDKVKALSASIVGSETNPVLVARKLYDWTLQNVDYWVKDPDHQKASPVGSTEYCLTTKTGNCTDFHSLFASLAMSAGLPTRMVYGSLLKPTLNGLAVDASYHCWIQFYAPKLGWIPLDASLANIYGKKFALNEKNQKLVELTTATGYKGYDPRMVDFYFGNLDDRRVVWSVGRDLLLQPPQDEGPVNALAKAYVEIDGKQTTDWTRKLSYKEL